MNADLLPPEPSPWLRIDAAAAYAGVHKAQVFRACARRQLRHARIGGRRTILLQRPWIDEWLQGQIVDVKAGAQ